MIITNVMSLSLKKKGTFIEIKKGEVEQEQVNNI